MLKKQYEKSARETKKEKDKKIIKSNR